MINAKKLKDFYLEKSNPTELKELVKTCICNYLNEDDIMKQNKYLLFLNNFNLLETDLEKEEDIIEITENHDIMKKVDKIIEYVDYLAGRLNNILEQKVPKHDNY